MASDIALFFVYAALLLRTVSSQTSTVNYCLALADVLSICEEETSSFTLLPVTAQANCLCGSQLGTIAWGPSSFDELASACAVQYATIDATIASDASSLQGFCTEVEAAGTVAATPTPSTQNNIPAATTAATPQNTVSSFPVSSAH